MKLSRLSRQSKFLMLKCTALAFKAVRYSKSFAALIGYAAGIAYVAINLGRFGRLEKYREAVVPDKNLWIFACKYYSYYAKLFLWGHIFYKDSSNLRSYVSVEGSDMVKRALEEGRGAIILGYHYGPSVVMYLLREVCKIPVRVVIDSGTFYYIRTTAKSLFTPWLRYFSDTDFLVAGKNTQEMVKHLRRGGAVLMANDFSSEGSGVMAMDFLGRTLNFSYFPFKASLKYSIPLFFCILKEDGAGGYRLVFVPCDGQGSVKDNLKSYLELISAQIKSSPFMWTLGREFSSWP